MSSPQNIGSPITPGTTVTKSVSSSVINFKVKYPLLAGLIATIITALIAWSGNIPGLENDGNEQWVVPLVLILTSLGHTLVGYLSPSNQLTPGS